MQPMHISADANKSDEELVEEIVMKLRKIGDEFNKNDFLKKELQHVMTVCIKAALQKRIKETLGEMTGFMNVIGWIE